MTLSNIHWAAVVICALVGIASGATWFGPKTFFPVWWKAMGHSETEIPGQGMNMGVVFGSTFIAQFVQAFAMALIMSAVADPNFGKGLGMGLVVGIGIAAASSLGHRLFGGLGFKVWAIEVSNDVINLAIIGAILGAWN